MWFNAASDGVGFGWFTLSFVTMVIDSEVVPVEVVEIMPVAVDKIVPVVVEVIVANSVGDSFGTNNGGSYGNGTFVLDPF